MQRQNQLRKRISFPGNFPSRYFQKTILLLCASVAFLICLSQPHKPGVSTKTLALFNAIRSGNAEQLQQQLANGANANDTLK